MSAERKKIAPSPQFHQNAVALGENMAIVLTAQNERDTCAIRVAHARGAVLAAEQELEIRERCLAETRALMEPQAAFHLSVMQGEAEDNVAALRAAREEEKTEGEAA